MKSKSVIYFVVMLFFVGGFFIGCNKQAQESVKIGVIMPLTGGAAVYGVPSVNAMKLALEQFKEKKQGNFNVDFIVEDSQADAAAVKTDRTQSDNGKIAMPPRNFREGGSPDADLRRKPHGGNQFIVPPGCLKQAGLECVGGKAAFAGA